eukprot:CAMPEP_0113934170 /NCGR_PEP_ID=MMETSP1339-20121228/1500_1 /TAXON_ID=94617 /ORGANISM="Fibrocapsa japonica" /LENGTH=309 /DNA_ID=CAMNT_0000935851 /DNA_START=123 /DNA_END=1052 /DNA_ORIENTATION=- /assembly_acc=CAM_ASM_000762
MPYVSRTDASPLDSSLLEEHHSSRGGSRGNSCWACCKSSFDCQMGPKETVFLVVMVAIYGYIIFDLITSQNIITWVMELTEFMVREDLAMDVFVLLLTMVLVVVVNCSTTIVCAISGYVFTMSFGGNNIHGVAVGTAVCWVGESLGSLLTFVISKYFLKECARNWFDKHRVLKVLARGVLRKKGATVTILLRIALLPGFVVNYMVPLSKIYFRQYVIGLLGIIPWACVGNYFGSAVSSIASIVSSVDTTSNTNLIYIYVGSIAVLLFVVGLIVVWTRNLLEEEIRKSEHSGDHMAEDDQPQKPKQQATV